MHNERPSLDAEWLNRVIPNPNTLEIRKEPHMIADFKPEVDNMSTRLVELRRYL